MGDNFNYLFLEDNIEYFLCFFVNLTSGYV